MSPLTTEEFAEHHWGQHPLYVPRSDPGYFARDFSLDALDSLLLSTKVRPSDIRLYRDQGDCTDRFTYPSRWSSPDNLRDHGAELLVDVGALQRLLQSGATIAVNQVGDYAPGLAHLCRSVEATLRCKRVVCNAYLSPAGSEGWGAHYDLDDLFVLQLEGEKRWRVFEAPVELPAREIFVKGRYQLGSLVGDWLLKPGDTLYLPRGFVHEPITTTSHSLHITVTCLQYLMEELLAEIVAQAALRDVRLRRALPFQDPSSAAGRDGAHELGSITEQLTELTRSLVDERTVAQALSALCREVAPPAPPPRHLRTAAAGGPLTLRTRLVSLEPRVTVDDRQGRTQVSTAGKTVSLPGHARAELLALVQAREPTSLADLPGTLDATARMTLARRLLATGWLTVAD